jgi:hypothetical protein
MSMLLSDMAPEDMAQICSKALMALMDDSTGVKLEHNGHTYVVHRDGSTLYVVQADDIPSVSDTIVWDPGDTGTPYLGI